jgi:hypothetical protein
MARASGSQPGRVAGDQGASTIGADKQSRSISVNTASRIRNRSAGASTSDNGLPTGSRSPTSRWPISARSGSDDVEWRSRASTSAPKGRSRSSSAAAPMKGWKPSPRERSRTSTTSRDFPIPASPWMRPTWQGPSAAPRSKASREANSAVRPTNGTVPGDDPIIRGNFWSVSRVVRNHAARALS